MQLDRGPALQAGRKGRGSVRRIRSQAVRDSVVDANKGSIRLFLDTARISEWERAAATGAIWGFTTNPVILEKDGVRCTHEEIARLAAKARQLGMAELQVQTWGSTAQEMQATALRLLDINPELLTIKVPCTYEGLQAASGIRKSVPTASITITGVYSPSQVMLAQGIGADYMAPYLGRMGDAHMAGGMPEQRARIQAFEEVAQMQQMVGTTGSGMRILVASIRDAAEMARLQAEGCDTFTFSPAVMDQLCGVASTLQAAADFQQAAERNGKPTP